MQATLIDINQSFPTIFHTLDIKLTFKNFILHLQNRILGETTIKKKIFEFVLQKFLESERLSEHLEASEMENYVQELNLLYTMLMPAISDEKEILWGLSVPVSPIVFYGTPAFYNLLLDNCTGQIKCAVVGNMNGDTVLKQKLQGVYSLILEKLYHFAPFQKTAMIHSYIDEITGLPKYYDINVDTRFVDVVAKESLPRLDFDSIDEQSHEGANWDSLLKILPLSMFRFEGFSIISLTDVTAQHAVENIKNILLNRSVHDGQDYGEVVQSLKTLVGNQQVEFGLLPILRVNKKLVFNHQNSQQSILVRTALDSGVVEETYLPLLEHYFRHPKLLFFKTIEEADGKKHPFLKMIKDNGVQSYALLPVYYNNKIAGVLEIYARQKDILNTKLFAKLDTALPLLAQILQHSIDEFDAGLENVIKDKFTSLQPAVQWRFNEVAWHYLRDASMQQQKPLMEKIHFKNVYPLYGAIDIRNSTIERNDALSRDMQTQFAALINTLEQLKEQTNLVLMDELIFKCKRWAATIINRALISNVETKVNDFFGVEINPVLLHIKESNPALAYIVDEYVEITSEKKGAAFKYRRALESSMQMINKSINNHLELFKTEVQKAYPSYFEKFRTDGIEYDIYIGQSIAPETNFDYLYLKNSRLWQLKSMATIAKATHAMLLTMDKPLETTQLIFIHSNSIDISFRSDERRFDVEGAYNIRYHVVKKRIDKVHVKNTGERLTQPGKIALVYLNKKEATEYVEYINFLQEQNILDDNLEYLELEELQGVDGLKALRIGVVMGEELINTNKLVLQNEN